MLPVALACLQESYFTFLMYLYILRVTIEFMDFMDHFCVLYVCYW